MPMSSGLRNGRYGSGAAEPSEATLATSVQTHRPAARTAAALVRYASGSVRTGQTRAVAGRGRSSSIAAGTTSQPSHGHALAKSPHVGGRRAAEQRADERERDGAERVHDVRRRLRPERRGEAQDERVRGEGDRPRPPAAAFERIGEQRRVDRGDDEDDRRVRQRGPGDLGPVEPTRERGVEQRDRARRRRARRRARAASARRHPSRSSRSPRTRPSPPRSAASRTLPRRGLSAPARPARWTKKAPASDAAAAIRPLKR